jgi:acetyl-CoA acetyltransferase family protein
MEKVAIIGGARTPFVKSMGAYKDASFLDLGVVALKGALEKTHLNAEEIDEVIFGTVLLDPRTPNYARELCLRAGLPKTVNAHAISNNCISGLVAANFAADGIKTGRLNTAVIGGSESMSRPTLTFNPLAEKLFLKLGSSRSALEKISTILRWRPSMALPVPPSPKEPSTGLTMGQHCELMAKEWGIARDRQDKIALRSHERATAAAKAGYLKEEIVPVGSVEADGLIRADTSFERLSKLSPVFDRSDKGTITAGNASALTDGASMVVLMSEKEARNQKREPLAYLEAIEFAAVSPGDGLLMAPAVALPKLLARTGVKLSQIDFFEIHEAFGAQVLCNMDAWEKGWLRYPDVAAIGAIPADKINVNGGSIALGHPFAATGGRILLSVANHLKRTGKRHAVISICAAGGMAAAALVSR